MPGMWAVWLIVVFVVFVGAVVEVTRRWRLSFLLAHEANYAAERERIRSVLFALTEQFREAAAHAHESAKPLITDQSVEARKHFSKLMGEADGLTQGLQMVTKTVQDIVTFTSGGNR